METILGIDLPTWWYLVIGAVFTGYTILDGFDLGAGAVHLFFNKEESRRIALNAIGPVWDGNEVWLVIGGGALFAGFGKANDGQDDQGGEGSDPVLCDRHLVARRRRGLSGRWRLGLRHCRGP